MTFAKLAAIALLATPLSASAQTTAAPPPAAATAAPAAPATVDADPALWVVKDEDTTIYLFGTVHVLKPGLSWFDEGVKAAFDKADALVLEMVMPDPATVQAMVMKLGMAKDGTPLSQKLPATDREAYSKAVAEVGAPLAVMEQLKPWLAATEFSVAPLGKLGYSPANGPEAVLTAAARAANKQVIGMETAEQQFGYLDGLSEKAQVDFLDSAIKDMPKLGTEMGEMVADWSKGDPEALANIMNDELTGEPELKQTLLIDRNARFASWIAERMKRPGTVFVAVGAGHLAGPDSVQADLAKTYKMKAVRVKY
ncbi:MAG: TraB/GumN family protein [Sphingomonas sp.]